LRQRIHVNFQPDTERRVRTNSWSNAAQVRSGNCEVKLKRVGPKHFIAKRIEAEGVPSLCKHSRRIRIRLPISFGYRFVQLDWVLSLRADPTRIALSTEKGHDCGNYQKNQHYLEQTSF